MSAENYKWEDKVKTRQTLEHPYTLPCLHYHYKTLTEYNIDVRDPWRRHLPSLATIKMAYNNLLILILGLYLLPMNLVTSYNSIIIYSNRLLRC